MYISCLYDCPGLLAGLIQCQWSNHERHGQNRPVPNRKKSLQTDSIENHVNISQAVLLLSITSAPFYINTLKPRRNGRHLPVIFNCSVLNENTLIAITISLHFVPEGTIDNILSLVQIMAWCQPLSEPMMVSLLTHICVTRPQLTATSPRVQWVKHFLYNSAPFY